jgi:hypothetical protein
LRSWRDGWRHLKLLLEYAPRWLFLYPGAALASMGALLTAALVPGPLRLGELTLDAATLLFAVAAILVGTQLMLFYAVAKSCAVGVGLLPASERFERLSEALTVDRFCLAGAGLFVGGLAIAAIAILRWGAVGFGDLDAGVNVRLAAVSTLALALGVQSVTTGFLLGLVRQRRSGSRGEPRETDASAFESGSAEPQEPASRKRAG